jgi:hypothetical protein
VTILTIPVQGHACPPVKRENPNQAATCEGKELPIIGNTHTVKVRPIQAKDFGDTNDPNLTQSDDDVGKFRRTLAKTINDTLAQVTLCGSKEFSICAKSETITNELAQVQPIETSVKPTCATLLSND